MKVCESEISYFMPTVLNFGLPSPSTYRHNCGDKIVALYLVLSLCVCVCVCVRACVCVCVCVCVCEPSVAVMGIAFLLFHQQVPGLSLVLETAILSFSWISSVSTNSLRDNTLKQSNIASFASFPIRYSPSPYQSTL